MPPHDLCDRRGRGDTVASLLSLRRFFVVALLCTVSACASSYRTYGPVPSESQVRRYAPPGPSDDPWGPYIAAASRRFGVPEAWIREVMRQESGGQQYVDGTLVTSVAGAMGLMQVMPQTYEELRQRYGLGSDPYNPRDNILAGAAYIGELYDRYGAPGFLIAYNAGPQRADGYFSAGARLPSETAAYMSAVGPRIGGPVSASAMPAGGVSAETLNRQSLAATLPSGRLPAPNALYGTRAGAAADPAVDALNRQALVRAGGGSGQIAPSAEDLNRQMLSTLPPSTP